MLSTCTSSVTVRSWAEQNEDDSKGAVAPRRGWGGVADKTLVVEDALSKPTGTSFRSASTEAVRSWLRAAGAPLWAAPLDGPLPELEVVVAAGLVLAHHDASVAVVLPVLLWRLRERLSFERLAALATDAGERQTLGCFLDLAGHLGSSRPLLAAARSLHARRRSRLRLFFTAPLGRHGLALVQRNTPRLARKWGFLMNLGQDTFADTFAKHTRPT